MRRKTIIFGLSGLFVLAAAALWVANIKGLLPGYSELRSYTDDASGLTDGTKVRLDGIPIGYLDHQRLTGSADRSRRVAFDLKVKSSYLDKIPVDSQVGVVADNLLGDKAINITLGHSPRHVESGAELRPAPTVDPNKMMAQMGNTLQDFQKVVDRANNVLASVDAGSGSIGKLKEHWETDWSGIPKQAQSLMKDYTNANGTMRKVLIDNDELKNQVQTTQARINDIMAGLQGGQGTAGKLPDLQKDMNQIMQEMDKLQAGITARSATMAEVQQQMNDLMTKFNGIAERINAGQGTLGQLMVNPQLSQALAGTSAEFQAFLKEARANPKKFVAFKIF